MINVREWKMTANHGQMNMIGIGKTRDNCEWQTISDDIRWEMVDKSE